MMDEIKEGFAEANVEIIEGSGGVFEVTVDGSLIYSKKETGQFPEKGKVISLMK